jgi:pimeloyl-ACP methyl ester carboxylesterase
MSNRLHLKIKIKLFAVVLTNSFFLTDRVAVVLHGLLGYRRNWYFFIKKFSALHPNLSFLLVDLRNHGDSHGAYPPHTLLSCANDIMKLVDYYQVSPYYILGHSFGGKVGLKFTELRHANKLMLPQQAWVLDTYPTTVEEKNLMGSFQGSHIGEVLRALRSIKRPITDRDSLKKELIEMHNFGPIFASWMTTNLKYTDGINMDWKFNLDSIEEMFKSYKQECMWDYLGNPPGDMKIKYVRAEKSNRWTPDILARFDKVCNVSNERTNLYTLENAGHWVHVDNPDGLMRMLSGFIAENEKR